MLPSGVRDALAAVRHWVRGRVVLAGSAAATLTLGPLADLGLSGLIETIVDLALVPLVVVAIGGVKLTDIPLGAAAQGLFFLALIYVLVPEFFPSGVGEWPTDVGARWILSVAVFASLVAMHRALDVPVILAMLPIVGLLLFGYFHRVDEAPVTSADGALFKTGRLIMDSEESDEEALAEFREVGWVTRGWYGLSLSVLIAVYLVFIGVLFYVVSLFSPLPELGTLLLTAHSFLGEKVDRWPDTRTRPDLDVALYETLSAVVRHPLRGGPALLILLMGLALGAMPFLTLLPVGFRFYQFGFSSTGTGLILVVVLTLAVAWGGYIFWFWQRLFRRFPWMMAALEGEAVSGHDIPIARPVWGIFPGLVLPVFGACSSIGTALYYHHVPRESGTGPVAGALFLLGALVSLAIPLWAVRRTTTTRVTAQSIGRDRYHFAVGYTALVGSVGLFSAATTVYESVKESGLHGLASIHLPALITDFALLTPVLLGMFAFEDVYKRARAAEEPLRFGLLVSILAIITLPIHLLATSLLLKLLLSVSSLGVVVLCYMKFDNNQLSLG